MAVLATDSAMTGVHDSNICTCPTCAWAMEGAEKREYAEWSLQKEVREFCGTYGPNEGRRLIEQVLRGFDAA